MQLGVGTTPPWTGLFLGHRVLSAGRRAGGGGGGGGVSGGEGLECNE